MKTSQTLLALPALMIFSGFASAQVDKLYVLDCGWSHNADVSRWTPGVNAGKPVDMSENCFLIHDAKGYFLWDTGYPGAVAAMADGQSSQGGVTVISTPGHTVGHESLLVHLPKTGWVTLSGDAVHLKENRDARRVPSMNADKEKTVTSMQRLADLMAEHKAQLWINHDKPQSDALPHAPKFYE